MDVSRIPVAHRPVAFGFTQTRDNITLIELIERRVLQVQEQQHSKKMQLPSGSRIRHWTQRCVQNSVYLFFPTWLSETV